MDNKEYLGGYNKPWWDAAKNSRKLLHEYNTIDPWNIKRRDEIIKELFGEIGPDFVIEPPFHCDCGNNIFIGKKFYANYNVQMLDGAKITIGDHALIGPNVDEMGPRFCDMTYVYPKALRDLAKECADELNIELREGVYLGCTGPSYETPAEIRAFRILGADMVGMSTVPEAIVASHSGMPVLAISLITNMAAGVLDQPLTLEEVVEVGQLKTQVMQTLVTAIVGKM